MALCICGCRDGHEHRLDERGMSGDVICRPCGTICGERIDLAPPGVIGRTRFRFRLWDGSERVSTGVPWRVSRPVPCHTCGLSGLPCAACIVARAQENGAGAANSIVRAAYS